MKYLDSEPLFFDNHLLVVCKPAGVSTQPHFEEAMKEFVRERKHKKGAVFLHAIHRLDRVVEGLVLFARTSKALSRLNEQMREGRIERIYYAEVEGNVARDEGFLEHYLLHGDRKAVCSHAQDMRAKRALLSYSVLGRSGNSTELQVTLHTGRYHQIRVQCAAAGHPIVGDTLYGACSTDGVRLRCQQLSFFHPISQERISISLCIHK